MNIISLTRLSLEKKPLLGAALVHLTVYTLLFLILYKLGIVEILPTERNIIQWDTVWYKTIRDIGYYYTENEQNPTAFFPLFPFLWKLTGLSGIGISILNSLIFIIGFTILSAHLKLTFKQNLLFLSTPSLFFCFVPYTEAIFFFGSSLLLIGLNRDKISLIVIGLIVTASTRSIGIVFIPAFVFTNLFFIDGKISLKNVLRIVTGVVTVLIISIVAFYIQFLYTGEWFVFFKVQKTWNRQFQIPSLPLTTFTNFKMLWLDGIAFFFTLLSAIYIMYLLAIRIKKLAYKTNLQPATVFSLAYLSIMGFVSTFFSGVWSKEYGTTLMSINRYVFATPFFFILIKELLYQKNINEKTKFITFFVTMLLTWLLLGLYRKIPGNIKYLPTFLYFSNMTAYLTLFILSKKISKFFVLTYLINIILMILLFNRFLNGKWVG